MRRLLLILALLISALVNAQDIKPISPNFKPLQSPSFSYFTTDSTVWIYKGATYGWTKLVNAKDLKDTIKYYVPYIGALKNVDLGNKRITSTKQRLPLFNGACVIPTILDNGDGTITVGSGEYHLSTQADGKGTESFVISGGLFSLTDNTTNYLVADYNSGTPILHVITDVNLINETTVIPIYTAYRSGIALHFQNWDALGVALANKVHQSIVKTQRYRRESGLALSEYGTRNLSLTSGRVWVGAVPISVDAIATATDNIRLFYHSAGNWVYTTQTQYDNTQYDNGTNLVTLTSNRYAVSWIFRGIESQKHLYVVLGTGDYTLAQAQDAKLPSIPTAISSHAMLVGKLIVQRDATTATSIQSAFDTQFSTATPNAHNDLTGRDVSDVHPAGSITFTPSGTISSTTVAAAITELDTEKEPVFSKGDLSSGSTALSISNGTGRLVGSATSTISVSSGYVIPTTTQISQIHPQGTDIQAPTRVGDVIGLTQTTTTISISDKAPASGSGNYIQNGTNTQTASYNIDGTAKSNEVKINYLSKQNRTDINYVFEGDSRTAIGTYSTIDWPQYLSGFSNFVNTGNFYNVATGGDGIPNIVSNYASEVYPKRPNGTTIKESYLFVLIGINDLTASNPNASDLATQLINYCNTATNDGFRVVLFTTFYRQDFTTIQEIARKQFNELLRANSTGYYSLIDLENLFPPSSSSYFYIDAVHLKSIGNFFIAKLVNSLFPLGNSGNSILNRITENDVITPSSGEYKINGSQLINSTQNIPFQIKTTANEVYVNLKSSGSDSFYGTLLRNTGNDFGIYHGNGVGNSLYINGTTKEATFASTIQSTTGKFTNLTDGYIPYHISDASGLGDSPISVNSGQVQINTNGIAGKFNVGGLTVLGSTIDPSESRILNITDDAKLVLSSDKIFSNNPGSELLFSGRYRGDNPYQMTFGSISGFKENVYEYSVDGYLSLKTNSNSGGLTEKMRITSSGNVGIGYSTGTEITNNKLAVNGGGYFNGQITSTTAKFTTGASANTLFVGDATGLGSWNTVNTAIGGNALINGSLPYWDGSKLANSGVTQNGTITGIYYGKLSLSGNQGISLGFDIDSYSAGGLSLYSKSGNGGIFINDNGAVKINNLAGTGTRLTTASSDGTLGTLGNGTGYLQNDGSGNMNFNYPEITSLRTTGTSANQVPISNGSNGVNMSALKTINGSSLFGSGDLILGGGNVSNTGTPISNQIPIWTNATTIKGTTNLTWNTDNSTYHYLNISSPSPSLYLTDSDYASPLRQGFIGYNGSNADLYLYQYFNNVTYALASFRPTETYLYTIQPASTSQVLYYNSSSGQVTYGSAPSGGGMTYPTGSGLAVVNSGTSWGTTISLPNDASQYLRGNGTWGTPTFTSQWNNGTYGIDYQANGVGIGRTAIQNYRLSIESSTADVPALYIRNTNSSGHGIWCYAGSSSSQSGLYVGNYAQTQSFLDVRSNGEIWLASIPSTTPLSNVLYYDTSTHSVKYGATPSGGGGSGTVTSFSAGSLSPLFTTSVANNTTTPALSFSLSTAGSYTVFGNQTAGTNYPSFGKLNINTIDASGTPSSSTYLRGDGSWSTNPGYTNYWQAGSGYIAPATITNKVLIGSTSDAGSYILQVSGDSRIDGGELLINTTSDNGVRVQSSGSGYNAFDGTSNSADAALLKSSYSTSNDSQSILRITRLTTGTASSGIGGHISFYNENSNGSVSESGRFGSFLSNVTFGSQTGVFSWSLPYNGSITEKMTLSTTGTSTIGAVLKLAPSDAAPASPTEGMIYSNSTDHHLYFYNGTTWKQLDN